MTSAPAKLDWYSQIGIYRINDKHKRSLIHFKTDHKLPAVRRERRHRHQHKTPKVSRWLKYRLKLCWIFHWIEFRVTSVFPMLHSVDGASVLAWLAEFAPNLLRHLLKHQYSRSHCTTAECFSPHHEPWSNFHSCKVVRQQFWEKHKPKSWICRLISPPELCVFGNFAVDFLLYSLET